jgi:hypothetical protein
VGLQDTYGFEAIEYKERLLAIRRELAESASNETAAYMMAFDLFDALASGDSTASKSLAGTTTVSVAFLDLESE